MTLQEALIEWGKDTRLPLLYTWTEGHNIEIRREEDWVDLGYCVGFKYYVWFGEYQTGYFGIRERKEEDTHRLEHALAMVFERFPEMWADDNWSLSPEVHR